MYTLVSISHHDETLPSSSVYYTLWPWVSSMSPEQVLCALMYEVKPTSKSPPAY